MVGSNKDLAVNALVSRLIEKMQVRDSDTDFGLLSAPNPAASINATNTVRLTTQLVDVVRVASINRNRIDRKMHNKLASQGLDQGDSCRKARLVQSILNELHIRKVLRPDTDNDLTCLKRSLRRSLIEDRFRNLEDR